jgi:hypothetical protein
MPNTAKDDSARFRVPEGRRPEEFLNDAQLAELYRREVAEAGDKATPQQKLRAAKAAAAAALTAAAMPFEADEE